LPEIDRELMERYSRETGFHVDTLEKVYRLMEFLGEMNSIPEVREKLVLKGGTAINFIYFDIPRLSIDIDIDYIGSKEKEKMVRDREWMEDILFRLFRKLGYQTEVKKPYALLQYILRYRNTAGNIDRIKLEMNFFNRVPVFESVEKEIKNLFHMETMRVRTLELEELFGRKLRALVTRGTPRDLCDVYHLLESRMKVDIRKLRKCFIFYLCCHSDPRSMNLNFVEGITQRDVKMGLLPLLRKGGKIDVEEMKSRVLPLLREFFKFEKEEKEFIDELYDKKNYRPELLFEDFDYNRNIVDHPGIKWRIINI